MTATTASRLVVLSCDGTTRRFALDIGGNIFASPYMIEHADHAWRAYIAGNSERAERTIGTFATKRAALAALVAKAARRCDDKIEAIASLYLGVNTLDEQGRDGLDFHDLSVGSIRAALAAAYEAGRNV